MTVLADGTAGSKASGKASDSGIAVTINMSAFLAAVAVLVTDVVAATLIWAAVGQTAHWFRFVEGAIAISVVPIAVGYAIKTLRS